MGTCIEVQEHPIVSDNILIDIRIIARISKDSIHISVVIELLRMNKGGRLHSRNKSKAVRPSVIGRVGFRVRFTNNTWGS